MKFRNMKRFASAVMAGALALSLAVPAFAEEAVAVNDQTVVEGGYVATPISVLVPTTGTAQINPYGLPVVIGATADGDTIQIVDEQISNTPMYISNYGTTSLDVYANLTVIPKGGVSIKGAALAASDKGKEMNVALEVAGLNDDALKKGTEDESLAIDLYEKYADEATWSGLAGTSKLTATAAAKGATTATAAKSSAAMATLGGATVSGDTVTYGAKSIALFRLKGEMNAEPEKTATGGGTEDDPWAAEDGFTATIVFKFKPTPKTEVTVTTTGAGASAVTVAPPAKLKGFEGDTITFTFEAATGKSCTGAVTGMDGSAPAVTITESGSTGKYTGTFTMPKDDSTPGIALAITIPA